MIDYGCQAEPSKTGDPVIDCLRMLERGAPQWQIYRSNPRWFFMNSRRIDDMEMKVKAWRDEGVDFISTSEENDRPRHSKRHKSEEA